MRLAIYNFGLHVGPYDSAEVEGFRLREAANLAGRPSTVVSVGARDNAGGRAPCLGGTRVSPAVSGPVVSTPDAPSFTWGLDSVSVNAFSCGGLRRRQKKPARHWNVKQQWPPLVRVENGRLPDWEDGVARLERLHDHGPSPAAFHFKQAYDPAGAAYVIDRAVVRALVDKNSAGQADLLASVKTMPV